MKLYLSSYRIPTPDDLAKLIGKPFDKTTCALIPNAQDYYSKRAKAYKVGVLKKEFEALGLNVGVVDLKDFNDVTTLENTLHGYDMVWAMGGNTYCLRYEMERSGFDKATHILFENGIVYGGDSAGALVAGTSIAGVESADEPAYAEKVIREGIKLVPYVILPHVDNADFAEAVQTVRAEGDGKNALIELKDSQAVIFDGGKHWVVTSALGQRARR